MADDVLKTVAEPDRLVAGSEYEVLAIRKLRNGKTMVVPYLEPDDRESGYIITAFLTTRTGSLDQREHLWP